MTTNGRQIATEMTIRMCTPGDGRGETASGRGEAGCIGTTRLYCRTGRKRARQMDTALVGGYPRRQRRQVTASYYTLLCISFWFRSRGGVEGCFGRASWCRDDWPGMAGVIGVEAEICVSRQSFLRSR